MTGSWVRCTRYPRLMDVDARCDAFLSGDTDAALKIDQMRAWRYVMALIDHNEDVLDQVQGQVTGCLSCSAGFASTMAGLTSGVLIERHGKKKARAVAERMLNQVMDNGPYKEKPK